MLFDRPPPRPKATRGCAYVTRVRIDHHGRIFEPGAPFPFAELGKTELDAYNMHRAGLLAVATPPAPVASEPVAASAALPPKTLPPAREKPRSARR